MKTSIKRTLVPIGFLLVSAALVYLWVKIEKPFSEDPPIYEASVAEDLVQAEAAQLIIRPRTVYASYQIIRNFGVQKATGATWVETDAWQRVSNDPQTDNSKFITDLITTLTEAGTLDDIDLNKRGNHLVVLWPGAPPRKGWVLDSQDIPKQAEE